MKHLFFATVCVLLAGACKKIDNNVPAIKGAQLNITSLDILSLDGPLVVSTSSLDLSGGNYTYGFCYSESRIPVIPGSNNTADNYTAGGFSAVLTHATYGTKYFVRSFITNGFATAYSNVDSFVMPQYIYTDTVKNISARSFDVHLYTLPAIADSITERGVCYDTLPSPDISNWKMISPVTDTGRLLLHVTDTLLPGRTYYLRSYLVANGRPLYGNEVNFKTAGYKDTYGYIIFDKGDTTNGWRYVQAALDSITRPGVTWGCSGTVIPGLLAGMGSGLANTEGIVNGCTDTTTAAYTCLNLILKTRSDWYLPSLDEAKALYELKLSAVITRTPVIFTSSQASASDCYILDFSSGTEGQISKSAAEAIIWPVRRY